MSELLGIPNDDIKAPEISQPPEGKFETDVEGVYADGKVVIGLDEFPVFKVDKDVFMRNMVSDRKRLRFPVDSEVGRYFRSTKYLRPFYIEFEDDGKTYRRKVR